ncbi:TolC family protein [Cytophaga aurantiaca]|uniref:TolC family protein n=1 Tax=Cytophaga aurantiaca TaxID=29530 RepID=UPI000367490A|nr:efflux transporter outer membrane subunit [Cytophaga aurantiaca]
MIQYFKKYKSIYWGLAALLFVHCAAPKSSPEVSLKALPKTYINNTDSTNIAKINWKQYFTDPVLVSLIDTALVNNLDVLIAYQKINASRAQVKYAKGLSAPKVNAAVTVGGEKFGDHTMTGVGNFDTNLSQNITSDQKVPDGVVPEYYLGLQSSWEVDVWGKLRNKRKAATAHYLASVEGKNWVVTNLITEVATTYYELLALDSEIQIIDETIELQQDQLELVIVQKQAGRANELAVNQFQAQLLQSKILRLELSQKIVQSENHLNYLLGRYPQPIAIDTTSFTNDLPTQVQVGIPSQLLSNRPDIKKAELELKASKANVLSAKAAFYPAFSITATLGLNSFNSNYIFSPTSLAYNAFGGLVTPLINQSAIKAQFRTAKAEQVEAMYQYQKHILNGYVEVYNQMVYINNLSQIYDLKDQEVKVLTTSIETASELFLTGRATYLEVIVTRSATLQSKLQLIEIKKKQFTAVVNIYRALGGGWN